MYVAVREADWRQHPEVRARPSDDGHPPRPVLQHCPPPGHLHHRQHQEVHQQPVCAEDEEGDAATVGPAAGHAEAQR